uniref:VWFA domain-containing protein n=1 Tax=Panagrolaimus sp. JU765 TaxID=591449 RepID=A0AC34QIA1_9BILA
MKKIIVLFLLVNFVVVHGQGDYVPCQFFVHYAIDNSNSLTANDYQTQLNFVSNSIGTLNHGERIEVSSQKASVVDYNQQTDIPTIQNLVKATTQLTDSPFSLDQTLKIVFGKISSYQNSTVPKVAFVFIPDTITNGSIGNLSPYLATEIMNHDYQLNFVLMGPKARQSDLANFAVNFITWSDLQQPQPDSWTSLYPNIFSCRNSSASGYAPCQAFVAFGADVSKTLAPNQFQNQLQFISAVIGGINHPERIMYSAGFYSPVVWKSPYGVSDIQSSVINTKQQTNVTFSLALILKSIYGAYLFSPNTTVPMAAVVFVSDTSDPANLDGAQFYADALIRSEIKLTLILMGNNINQNLLSNITNNFITWKDLSQQQPDNWGTLYGPALGCSGQVSTLPPTTTGPTTIATVPSSTSTVTTMPSSSASGVPSSTLPTTVLSSSASATSMPSSTSGIAFSTTATTTMMPYVPCQSFISFCVDNSNVLSSADFQRQIYFAASEISKLNYADRIRFQAGKTAVFKWENETDINTAVSLANGTQQTDTAFDLKYVLQDLYLDVIALKNSSFPRTAVIFVTDTSKVDNLAVTVANGLRNANVRLTLVLVGNGVDQSKLVNISTNFVVWTDLSQNPPNWDPSAIYGCATPSTVASSTPPSTVPSTVFTGSTTPKPFIPCQSYLAFAADNSNALSAADFAKQISFLSSQVSSITHIERLYIQAGPLVVAPLGSHHDDQLQQLLQSIAEIEQTTLGFGLRRVFQALYSNLLDVQEDGIPRAIVVFVTDTTAVSNYQGADQFVTMLKNAGFRITFVLTGNKVDQNVLTNLTDNFIIWNDLTQPQPIDWGNLFGPAFGCTNGYSTTIATGPTDLPTTTKTRQPITVQSTQTFQPSSSTLAPPTPAFTCLSHIPFGVDLSQTLTADQFTKMKNMVLDPFLSVVYPIQISPAVWVTFSDSASGPRKVQNATALSTQVQQLVVQGNTILGSIKWALSILNGKNAANYTDTYPVNTIFFTGSALPSGDVPTTQDLVTAFTANGNTVIVVLMKEDADPTNYNKIDGLKLVQYNPDQRYIISDMQKLMKCQTT